MVNEVKQTEPPVDRAQNLLIVEDTVRDLGDQVVDVVMEKCFH